MKPIQLTLFALALMVACGETTPHDTEGDSDTQNSSGSTMNTEPETTADSDVENPKDGMCWKGYLGCECDQGNQCHDLSGCNADTQMCECLGAKGCACTKGGACDPIGLVCEKDTHTCVFPPGEEGADCQADEDCHHPFRCDKESHSCQCSEGRAGCGCTEGGLCDDGPDLCNQETWTCECLMGEGCLCMPGGICDSDLTCVDDYCHPLSPDNR